VDKKYRGNMVSHTLSDNVNDNPPVQFVQDFDFLAVDGFWNAGNGFSYYYVFQSDATDVFIFSDPLLRIVLQNSVERRYLICNI